MNEEFLNTLSELTNEDDFKIWLSNLKIINHKKINQKYLFELSTNSSFTVDKIENFFENHVKNALSKCFNIEYDIITLSFTLESKIANIPQTKNIKHNVFNTPKNTDKKIKNDSNLIDYLNFDRYVYSDFNRIVYELSKRVIEKIGQINPFYIYSKVGMGKTHLLHAIGNYYKKNFTFLNVLYLTPNQFVSEYTQSIFNKTVIQFRAKYRSVDILLIDDIQFFIGKEKSCEEFFHLFNEIFSPNKQMVFCSDRMPSELGNIDQRLKSRLTSCVVSEIEDLKKIDKINIVNFYLSESNKKLPSNIFDFIIDSLPNDVRIITGIIKSIIIYQDIYHEHLTIDILKNNLKQLQKNPDSITYNPTNILENVSKYSKITISDLKSPKKDKATSFYRQIIMYLLRIKLNMSLTDIGALLGGKHSSTVHVAISKFQKKLETDRNLNLILEKILTL